MLENLPYFQRHLPEDLSRVNEVINQAVQSDVDADFRKSVLILSVPAVSVCARL